MIELSLSEYCLLIICAAFVLVGLFGWISSFAHRNAERRGRKVRFVCSLCLTTWEDRGRDKIVPCPHCGRDSERSS
jgi:hypothetical protein